ncbi:hypothetical protein OSTOST_00126 [Ostertagia ostertagi]
MDYMRAYTYYKQSPKVELDQTNTTKTMGFMQTFINTHPGSARNKEASEIIDKCRVKMELKELKSAELYLNLGQYKAAAIAFANLMNNFPDSDKGDQYKLQIIKSYYEYAALSIDDKKEERFEQEELHNKLEEFASHTDSLEEIHENKEQIEISKAYERMPNPALLATQEFMEDKIYHRRNEDNLFS